MGTGTKIGIGSCAAALCGWLLWPRAEPLAPASALEPPAQAAPARTASGTPPVDLSGADDARAPLAQAPKPALHETPSAPAPVPPGTIEGRVLRHGANGDVPVPDASVTLHENYDPRTALAALALPELASTRTSAEGKFRFARLAPGRYTLRAKTQSSMREGAAEVQQGQPGPRVTLILGSARIHGTLRGENGALLENVVLRLDGDERKVQATGSALRAVTQSDPNGNYAFEELPGGEYYLLVASGGGFWHQGWPGRMDRIVLDEQDDLQLDAGRSEGPAHWRGTLRTSTGEPALCPGTLHLQRDERSPGGSTVHTYVELRWEKDGKFDALLEPASWSVALSLQSHPDERHDCGTVEVTPGGLEQDLTLPGTRVFGTVTDAATGQALKGYARVLGVSLHRPGENWQGAMHESQLDEAAKFAIDMLDDGDWEVVTYPLELSAHSAGVSFHIEKGETQHRLDLEVRKP